MSTPTIQVDLVSNEEEIFSGQAEYLVAPGAEGELGIYPRHIPIISKLSPGVLRVKLPEHEPHLVFAISGGFLEVQSNIATVLADVVERSESLDEAKLLEQKRQAEEQLKKAEASLDKDTSKAYATLELVIAQLKALDYVTRNSRRS